MPVASRKAKKSVAKTVRVKRMTAKKPRVLARVIHYYDRLGVAILEVGAPIALGDNVRIRHGDIDLLQPVTSLQIDHQPIQKAKKGDIVGMQVNTKTREGSLVVPA